MATDLSPRMIGKVSKRAGRLDVTVEARVMDGESLSFPDHEFDHVLLHLVLAVMPDLYSCSREVGRVLKPGGTASIFDKFVPDGESPSLVRRVANVFMSAAFSDLTRQLGPIMETGGLQVRQRETAMFDLFTIAIAERGAA